MRRDGAYQDEVAQHTGRDNAAYALDPNRREAEDHARGVRSEGHLDDYVPACGLWYGADVIARASRRAA